MKKVQVRWLLTCLVVVASAITVAFYGKYQFAIHAYPDLPGTILYGSAGSQRLVPGAGRVLDVSWGQTVNPQILCVGRADTLLIWSGDPLFPEERRSSSVLHNHQYLYKYSPLHTAVLPITLFPDSSYWCNSLDYDSSSDRFLCTVHRNGKTRLLLMEGDFEFIRDLTPRQDHPFGDSLIQSAFFCWEGIVINYDESAWFYPVVGDSMSVHNFERPGRIAAVSHDKKMAYYTLGWKADQESYLFDVPIKASRCISTDYMIDACFSPDGRYLALSEITYNLMDDIKLYIYDIGEDEIIFTGVRNGSGLGAWISGVDK